MVDWLLIFCLMMFNMVRALPLDVPSCSTTNQTLPSFDENVYLFGKTFLADNLANEAATDDEMAEQRGLRSPLSMVLPEDSQLTAAHRHRQRRRVVCGTTQRRKSPRPLSFEQRSVCPFQHVENRDDQRLPVILNEVRCVCDRPSHLSVYTEIRCQPLLYKMPVLRRNPRTGLYEQAFEELTLACIPLTPKEERRDDDFMSTITTT